MRQCLWLPRQLGAMQAVLVRQQQFDSFGGATRADAFRLIEAVQRQHAVRLPTRFALAIEVQRRRLGIRANRPPGTNAMPAATFVSAPNGLTRSTGSRCSGASASAG